MDHDADLSSFNYATVYESENASFIELELESMMESLGYEVIGPKEAQRSFSRKGHVLGVRYHRHKYEGETTLRVLIEDMHTGKTLITAENTKGRMMFDSGEVRAWRAVRKDLLIALEELNARGFNN